MTRSITLLEALTQADGAPGFEDEVRAIFRDRLADTGELLSDRTGSVVCKKFGGGDRPRVLLDCHLDEVGFMVQHVTPTGFLKLVALGGWWGHVLPAQRLHVHGANGRTVGVIGSTPPHFLPPDQRTQVLALSDMFVDIGASSRAEAESWGVRIGSWAVPISPFTVLRNERMLLAKAFDNRVGCALLIESMLDLDASEIPGALYGTGSAQEEVGIRGARTAVGLADPDVAIVLEGTPGDDTPGMNPEESQAALGRGVQLRAYDPSMIANPRLVELALTIARESDIPLQMAVRSSGGTNAREIHLHERGVPTIVLGVPSRYIHAHTSVIHLDDYDAALRLVKAIVRSLDAPTVASLTR